MRFHKPQHQRVRYRNPFTEDIYVKHATIEPRFIQGIEFIPVMLEAGLGTVAGRIVWMRKDQLELLR